MFFIFQNSENYNTAANRTALILRTFSDRVLETIIFFLNILGIVNIVLGAGFRHTLLVHQKRKEFEKHHLYTRSSHSFLLAAGDGLPGPGNIFLIGRSLKVMDG